MENTNLQYQTNIDTNAPVVEEKKPKKKLSKIERKKMRIITKLIEGEINGTEAAKKLGITTRQVRNLKRQVLNEGVDGVIHKNKQYKPYNTYDQELSTFVCKLYQKKTIISNNSFFLLKDNFTFYHHIICVFWRFMVLFI